MSFQSLLVVFTQCYILTLICFRFSTAIQGNSNLNNDQVLARSKKDVETTPYFYYQQAAYPRDCKEVYDQCSSTVDGLYLIKPDGYPEPFEVFCNNTIDGGGWTVFQRHKYADVNFYRNWVDYKNGFGFLHRDFWLGNEKLAYLTNQKDYQLRIDLVSSSGESVYAHYSLFRISDEGTKYKLVALGTYSGDSGYQSMGWNRGNSFSTYDQDNDASTNFNCATKHRGGWWYETHDITHYSSYCYTWNSGSSHNTCTDSNLNGKFGETGAQGIFWYGLRESHCNIRYTEMKIRPVQSN